MRTVKPHPLLDELLRAEGLKNDSALSKKLKCGPDRLSKIRHGEAEVNDQLRVAIMRSFRWSLKRIDELAPPAAAE